MPVVCQVMPKEGLSADQLRALAESLRQWCQSESARRRDVMIQVEGRGLGDLDRGEYPRPLAERIADGAAVDPDQVALELGEQASSRNIELRIACDDRDELAASLREGVPASLVEDVLVGETSWSE